MLALFRREAESLLLGAFTMVRKAKALLRKPQTESDSSRTEMKN
jgi:hypothetical protein